MTWFYLASASVIFFTILNILSRKLSVGSKNPRAMSAVFNLSACVITSIYFFVGGHYKSFSISLDTQAWIYLIVAVVLYGLYERIRFYATKYVEASTLTNIGTLSVVVAFMASLFLYNENFGFMKIAGTFFVISSILIVSTNKEAKITRKGMFYGISSSLFLGGAWALDKMGAQNFNPETYNIMVWLGPFFFIYLFPTIPFKELQEEFERNNWKIILLALLNVAGYYFQLMALNIGSATRVIPIVQTSVITTVLASTIFLNERTNVPRKIIAATISLIGVYLLL